MYGPTNPGPIVLAANARAAEGSARDRARLRLPGVAGPRSTRSAFWGKSPNQVIQPRAIHSNLTVCVIQRGGLGPGFVGFAVKFARIIQWHGQTSGRKKSSSKFCHTGTAIMPPCRAVHHRHRNLPQGCYLRLNAAKFRKPSSTRQNGKVSRSCSRPHIARDEHATSLAGLTMF